MNDQYSPGSYPDENTAIRFLAGLLACVVAGWAATLLLPDSATMPEISPLPAVYITPLDTTGVVS